MSSDPAERSDAPPSRPSGPPVAPLPPAPTSSGRGNRAPIVVEDVWKSYRIGSDSSLVQRLSGLFRRGEAKPKTFWALRGVSFRVEEGQAMGVVGKNGAGKSTLLKVLCGVTFPTRGRCSLTGRVAPLIEVGAGFHPELTGRENIFLNACILGMSRRQVRDRVDEIIDFSELSDFIDTPVKRYSSGMLARLGFSVSIFVEPDVLLVDEVLSVGDLSFVLKSYRKITEIRRRGIPVLLVSHNLQLIRNFCDRAIWLHKGELRSSGTPAEVCNAYMKHIFDETPAPSDASGSDIYRVHADPDVSIEEVTFVKADGTQASRFETGEPFAVDIRISSKRKTDNLIIYVTVWQEESGQMLVNHNNVDDDATFAGFDGPGEVRCRVSLDRLPFVSGVHRVSVSVSEGDVNNVCDWHERMHRFSVVGGRLGYGAFYPFPRWSYES